jgi:hypothetical protein
MSRIEAHEDSKFHLKFHLNQNFLTAFNVRDSSLTQKEMRAKTDI